MVLPTNYATLSPQEKLLVVVDLERVNRGFPPVVGLDRGLNGDAQGAAMDESDPLGNYGIFAGQWSVLGADYEWMYNDGFGSTNVVCPAPGAGGCWGHRDNILASNGQMAPGSQLYAGAGFAPKAQWDSYTFVMDYGFPGQTFTMYKNAACSGSSALDRKKCRTWWGPYGVVFSWAQELPYFTKAPAFEPLR
jgi:hypothetical protein